MLALALLGQSATALADGRDVLADLNDNGRIDACYSRAELNEALDLLRGYDRLYGVKEDLLRRARITNVERPGQPCGEGPAAGAQAAQDGSGGSLAVFLGAGLAVGAVAVGAGAWAARDRGRRG
jgi:hypothetical protein